jgi:hypothetical protein
MGRKSWKRWKMEEAISTRIAKVGESGKREAEVRSEKEK